MNQRGAIGMLALATALPVWPQDAQALYTQGLAATCAGCHGTGGKALAGSSIVSLAGMPGEQLAAAMRAFKAGTRPATVMQQIAKGYSDAQIDQLAGWFAAQKK